MWPVVKIIGLPGCRVAGLHGELGVVAVHRDELRTVGVCAHLACHGGSLRLQVAQATSSGPRPLNVFASWLRHHSQVCDAYGRLKQGLFARGIWGHAYTDAKTDFIQSVVDRARAAQGLPPVPIGQPN